MYYLALSLSFSHYFSLVCPALSPLSISLFLSISRRFMSLSLSLSLSFSFCAPFSLSLSSLSPLSLDRSLSLSPTETRNLVIDGPAQLYLSNPLSPSLSIYLLSLSLCLALYRLSLG